MKRIAFFAGVILALGGVVFFIAQLWGERAAFASLMSMDMATTGAFLISAILFAAIYPLTGYVSARMLSDLRAPQRTSVLIGILCVSQLARYIPGNIGQHIARGTMLSARGVSIHAIALSLAMETLLAVLAACAVAAVALAFGFTRELDQRIWLLVGVVSLACLGSIALLVSAARFIPARLTNRFSLQFASRVSWSTRSTCFAAYVANYILVGMGLAFLAFSIGAPENLPLYVGAFALAWIAGFLAPGLPAGLGAREGVLVAILAPAIGMGPAVVVATTHRLSTTLGDAIAAVTGVAILRKRDRDHRGDPINSIEEQGE